MSRATVRAALKEFLAPPTVDGLNTVFGTPPKTLMDHTYTEGQPPGTASGAVGALFIEGQEDTPSATDGAGGFRMTTYQAQVQVFHMSIEPDADDAMAHFDHVIDGLVDRLRADPSLGTGTGGPIGSGQILSGAYEHLSVQFGEPEEAGETGGAIATWAVVRFPVAEMNRAT